MDLANYVKDLNLRYQTGDAREHTYRGSLQNLLEALIPGSLALNDPARIECGAPDFILTRESLPIGYLEAKDLGQDLNSLENEEQIERYRTSLTNFAFTNYMTFCFYFAGQKYAETTIAKIENGKVIPLTEKFEELKNLIENFSIRRSIKISDPKKLSIIMAKKSKLIGTILEKSIERDAKLRVSSSLVDQYTAIKEILINDISISEFADVYAQTLTYGLFAARINSPDENTFSRSKTAALIPKSNPFLRNLFQYVAGVDLDDRLIWIVDSLSNVFQVTDVRKLIENFGSATVGHDPLIHFYETFLAEYNPKLRKTRGVWYTPLPIVRFILKSVDHLLENKFHLQNGIANNSKVDVEIQTQTGDKRVKGGYKKVVEKVHKVQILDPAVGTGTFITETVRLIYQKMSGIQGIWNKYVEEDVIPRLNGFEILMASYSIAHLKMGMLLSELNYKSTTAQRFRIFLTNALEEHHPDTGTLFASWLSQEANEANYVKRDNPVMVVMGNPPYSVSSANKGKWINDLTSLYKQNLGEKNIQPLSDDYIKFIRFGHYQIDKSGEGILAYISNNSFLDGRIHRQMRKSLLESFSEIYILNLHGSTMKNEVAPDGSKDENVFDIKQGVSINILIKKKGKSKKLAELYYSDLFGTREVKYEALEMQSLDSIAWKRLEPQKPYFLFTDKIFSVGTSYQEWVKLDELFVLNACGLVTARDKFLIQYTDREARQVIDDFVLLDESEFRSKYNEDKDTGEWKYESAKKDVADNEVDVHRIDYRPFDFRFVPYSANSKGILSRPRDEVMRHVDSEKNISMLVCKQQSTYNFRHVFVTKSLSDKCSLSSQTKEASYQFPLFLKNEDGVFDANLSRVGIRTLMKNISLIYSETEQNKKKFYSAQDIFNYVYAALHSSKYRNKFINELSLDFPRIPPPPNNETFFALTHIGSKLVANHLLEVPIRRDLALFNSSGTNRVEREFTIRSPGWKVHPGKVFGDVIINNTQRFENIPIKVWDYWIGGYQPILKWLKERNQRELSAADIMHFQSMVSAIYDTLDLVEQIDQISFEF